jgi:hypothetical protein
MSRKIPVAATIAASYRFAFGKIGPIIGLIWLPVVLIAAGGWFFILPYVKFRAAYPGGSPLPAGLWGYAAVVLVLASLIAATLTREILLPPVGRSLFRLPPLGAAFRVLGSYLGLAVLGGAFAVGLAVLAAIVGHALTGWQSVAAVAALFAVGLSVLAYAGVRLAALLVPAAVVSGGFGIARSWRLTGGNFWRLILIWLAALLPIALISQAATALLLGLDFFDIRPVLHGGPAALQAFTAQQHRILADKFPLLLAVYVVLGPFKFGLATASAAFAFRSLTQNSSS